MQPAEAIRTALTNDDAALFRATLAQNPELKQRINDPLGPFDSPLILSVRSREMLEAFLDAGADLNAKSRWWAGGFSFLDQATDDLAAYALTRGAILTPHAAARLGRVDELQRMISENPEIVHLRGGDGQTPLHVARNVAAAKILVKSGADINASDIDMSPRPLNISSISIRMWFVTLSIAAARWISS